VARPVTPIPSNEATATCQLIDSRRPTCTLTESGVDFAHDAGLASVGGLLGVIEKAHTIEISAMKVRLARIAASAALLGAGASK
jgi:hypothetical protein